MRTGNERDKGSVSIQCDKQLKEIVQLYESGNVQGAIKQARQSLQLEPENGPILSCLGAIFLESGDPEKALEIFYKCSESFPEDADVWLNLGLALCQSLKLSEAKQALEKSIKLNSKNPIARLNLGKVFYDESNFPQAEEHFHTSLQLEPGNIEAQRHLAKCYAYQGKLVKALEAFKVVLKVDPDDLEMVVMCGRTHRQLGNSKDAKILLSKALELNPKHAQAWFNLTMLRNRNITQLQIENMKAVLQDSKTTNQDKILVGFALARALDDQGEFDAAFSVLEKANEQKKATLNVNTDKYEKLAERIIETYSSDYLSEMTGLGFKGAKPIFVFGMPRSGSTLVEQILGSHNQVFAVGENPVLSDLAKEFKVETPLDKKIYYEIGARYFERTADNDGTTVRTVDKSMANYFYVGLISLAFSGAKMINCVRSPLDTCLSCYQHLFHKGHGHVYDQVELGRYYKLYRRLIDYWNTVLPGSVLHFSYEKLINNQEKETRRLLQFCNLDWDPSCLEFYRTERWVRTASSDQVRQPIYVSSISKWKNYEAHLAPLIKSLGPYREWNN